MIREGVVPPVWFGYTEYGNDQRYKRIESIYEKWNKDKSCLFLTFLVSGAYMNFIWDKMFIPSDSKIITIRDYMEETGSRVEDITNISVAELCLRFKKPNRVLIKYERIIRHDDDRFCFRAVSYKYKSAVKMTSPFTFFSETIAKVHRFVKVQDKDDEDELKEAAFHAIMKLSHACRFVFHRALSISRNNLVGADWYYMKAITKLAQEFEQRVIFPETSNLREWVKRLTQYGGEGA